MDGDYVSILLPLWNLKDMKKFLVYLLSLVVIAIADFIKFEVLGQ